MGRFNRIRHSTRLCTVFSFFRGTFVPRKTGLKFPLYIHLLSRPPICKFSPIICHNFIYIAPQEPNIANHTLANVRTSATMTAGEPSHTDKDGAVPPRETSTKQPTADIAPAGLRPLSIANTMSTIGAKRTNPGQASLSKTIAASQTKVAIPRQRVAAAPRYNRRVPRACSSCRQRKTKCSGDTPICRQCRELRATCSYPDGWREKTKKYV